MENNINNVKTSECVQGGTYEAYMKAREVVLHSYLGGDKLICFSRKVSMAEFMEAVKVLMTFASKHPDQMVELYECDISCKQFKIKPCPGDCMLSEKSTKRCPFYEK